MDEDTKPPAASSSVSSPSSSPVANTTAARIAPKSSLVAGDPKGQAPLDDGSGDTAPGGGHPNASPAGRDCGGAWNLPDVVLAVYLLNPVIAGQCAALSGDVLGRALPLAALAAAGSGRPGVTAAALAAAACLWRFHAAPLVLPAALMLGASCSCGGGGGGDASENGLNGKEEGGRVSTPGVSLSSSSSEIAGGAKGRRTTARNGRRGRSQALKVGDKSEPCAQGPPAADGDGGTSGSGALFDPRYFEVDGKALLRLSVWFLAWCAAILGACWAATSGSWAFLSAAANGQLLCENLTPNIGLYWYFFAELFPRFRGFFRVLFLSQPYVYVLPATLRLGMFPEALVRGGEASPSWG